MLLWQNSLQTEGFVVPPSTIELQLVDRWRDSSEAPSVHIGELQEWQGLPRQLPCWAARWRRLHMRGSLPMKYPGLLSSCSHHDAEDADAEGCDSCFQLSADSFHYMDCEMTSPFSWRLMRIADLAQRVLLGEWMDAGSKDLGLILVYPLVNVYIAMERSTIF